VDVDLNDRFGFGFSSRAVARRVLGWDMQLRGTRADSPSAARSPGGRDVRVLIVDDQDYFRDVLRELVTATPGFAVAAEAASGEDALDATAALSPDLVVMDVRMPGLGGIDAARALMARLPDILVLLVSAQELPERPLTDSSGRAMLFAHKQDLRGALLREIWDRHDAAG
jgi:CheY-like chemotaxis protein